ncbi:MAG: sulfotransferase [Elainellaceae cyanobacterium]
MTSDSQILAITGMHRSGTSLTAQYLEECGLDIGQELHNATAKMSDQYRGGHHEDVEFVRFHREICTREFRDPSAINIKKTKLPIPIKESDRQQAAEILKRRENLSRWAWKDPRTTLFLNFWVDVLPEVKYLILLREPLSVVDSLIRRNKNKCILNYPIGGIKIWSLYNREILDFYRKCPHRVILFQIDDLIKEPGHLLNKMKNKFNIELKTAPLEQIFSKSSFKTQHSESVRKLEFTYSEDVQRANELFSQLKELSQKS